MKTEKEIREKLERLFVLEKEERDFRLRCTTMEHKIDFINDFYLVELDAEIELLQWVLGEEEKDE